MVGKESGEKKRGFTERYGMQRFLEQRDMIVLRGQGQATLYGCRKILRYSPEEIRLRVGRREVSLVGKGLICTCFSAGCVTVEGRIDALLYCTRDRSEEAGE